MLKEVVQYERHEARILWGAIHCVGLAAGSLAVCKDATCATTDYQAKALVNCTLL